MTDHDNTRRLAHVGDDEAFIERLKHAVPRLPSRNDNARLLASIQSATLQILLGATDSAARQVTHTDNRANPGTPEGGSIGFSISRDERAGNTRTGEKQDDGCAAAATKG